MYLGTLGRYLTVSADDPKTKTLRDRQLKGLPETLFPTRPRVPELLHSASRKASHINLSTRAGWALNFQAFGWP